MIIKHRGGAGTEYDLSPLINKIAWSGSRIQVARKLEFTYIQDSRDPLWPVYPLTLGHTIRAYDEEGTLRFQGNIYSLERKTSDSTISVLCYDNLFILSKSKTTRKFTNMTAEAITDSVCREMGINVGELAKTDIPITFIAPEKTGYQIIMTAYTMASKKTGKKYHPMMAGDSLTIIEKGTLIEGLTVDDHHNTMDSSYKESIENMVNRVMVTDEQGNLLRYDAKEEDITKYSMIQTVYKTNPNHNANEEIQSLFKGVTRSGNIDVLGDYRALSSYSIVIRDMISELSGKFWIQSDSHTFADGQHTMKLELEFENMMNEEHSDGKGGVDGSDS